MKTLNISEDLQLPLDAVTQTFGIMAKRGSGKTYTAKIFVEELRKQDLQVIVVDPLGVWWGLRSSADGKKPGIEIIIAGGEHGDIPIDPGSGEALAEMIVENRLSVVVDLSLFRKGEQVKFMVDFAETLYRRNRQAVHLVLDEADAFAPQQPRPDTARMLGAIEDLVRRGRSRGIGITMITQRPAVLNKNVLTQIEVLVVLKLTSPQDRKAINEWIQMNADADQAKEMLGSLQKLPVGRAWFYSPGWHDIFKQVQIRKLETLDSSSTPKAGEKVIEAKAMAHVNIEALREKLAATIQQAEERDPKVLQKRISELEKQLADRKPQVEVREKIVEVVPERYKKMLMEKAREIEAIAGGIRMNAEFADNYLSRVDPPMITSEDVDRASQSLKERELVKDLEKIQLPKTMHNVDPAVPMREMIEDLESKGGVIKRSPAGAGQLGNYAQDLIDTLKKFYPLKLSRRQLATLAGKSSKSSSYSAAIAELQRENLVVVGAGEVVLSDVALRVLDLDAGHPPAMSAEQHRHMWLEALPPYEKALFQALLKYRMGLTRAELAEESGRSASSSSYSSALATLTKNRLIEYSEGKIRAKDIFFEVSHA